MPPRAPELHRATAAPSPPALRPPNWRRPAPRPPPPAQTWYALIANAEWYFNDVQNEAMAEQLREKARFYKEQNMEQDFFFVANPKWLDAKFPKEAKQVRRPCVALVSPDKMWIK